MLANDERDALGRAECLALMGSVPVGRVVFTEQALPAVWPAAFALDGQSVVFRTTVGTRLDAALRGGAVVAFETDAFEPVPPRASAPGSRASDRGASGDGAGGGGGGCGGGGSEGGGGAGPRGWTVTAVGRVRAVRDPADLARLERLLPARRANGVLERVVRVDCDRLTGRRFPIAPPAPPPPPAPPAPPPPPAPRVPHA
ncbi:pyridoxamine 5'-phosphate oxidase family protein [Actinomadura gamaensis]|uniref:Pyridoxamine 5'-phosphate oxidase family protein n=1 Tax=Actinomadura gamaensis TaxID=1763541 RepID=A0ABV9TSG9_9ACTN